MKKIFVCVYLENTAGGSLGRIDMANKVVVVLICDGRCGEVAASDLYVRLLVDTPRADSNATMTRLLQYGLSVLEGHKSQNQCVSRKVSFSKSQNIKIVDSDFPTVAMRHNKSNFSKSSKANGEILKRTSARL